MARSDQSQYLELVDRLVDYTDWKANTPAYRRVMKPTWWEPIHQPNICVEFPIPRFN